MHCIGSHKRDKILVIIVKTPRSTTAATILKYESAVQGNWDTFPKDLYALYLIEIVVKVW